ncbi:shikimate dehydrogenase [bacterium]|nr:shikimate dehydrogenase [bacterium]
MSYKFAIIGYPIKHSLSPIIQRAALESCNLDGTYEIIETKPENLISIIKKLKTQNYQGFNVTIPHKVPITLFMEQFDEYANTAGSVNTVKIDENKNLLGYNTDIYGFLSAIPNGVNLEKASVAIMGTGGASRAIACAFKMQNVSRIDFFTRNILDSHLAIKTLREKFPDIRIELIQYEGLTNLSQYKMIVNTTPTGMSGHSEGKSNLSDALVETISDDAYVYDIVYNPNKTEFIKQAIRYNKKYICGLDMLIYQGAKAFEIWTGQVPNTDKMKIAALEYLT